MLQVVLDHLHTHSKIRLCNNTKLQMETEVEKRIYLYQIGTKEE